MPRRRRRVQRRGRTDPLPGVPGIGVAGWTLQVGAERSRAPPVVSSAARYTHRDDVHPSAVTRRLPQRVTKSLSLVTSGHTNECASRGSSRWEPRNTDAGAVNRRLSIVPPRATTRVIRSALSVGNAPGWGHRATPRPGTPSSSTGGRQPGQRRCPERMCGQGERPPVAPGRSPSRERPRGAEAGAPARHQAVEVQAGRDGRDRRHRHQRPRGIAHSAGWAVRAAGRSD